jgi:heme oxygenase (mycobilin-producing)
MNSFKPARQAGRYGWGMSRAIPILVVAAWLGACTTTSSQSGNPSPMTSLDFPSHPQVRFRIDSFSVPEPARAEFDAGAARSFTFLRTLPGFRGHWVFEKTGGPGRFNVITVAAWESQEAMDRASTEVQAYYQRIGFDPRAFRAARDISSEIGTFRVP